MTLLDRVGQVWFYRYQNGSTRVCLVTHVEQSPSEATYHLGLTLDFTLHPDRVGTVDVVTTDGNLVRHWERIA